VPRHAVSLASQVITRLRLTWQLRCLATNGACTALAVNPHKPTQISVSTETGTILILEPGPDGDWGNSNL
jgi:hypothetical protein